jgi:hypothetical protein
MNARFPPIIQRPDGKGNTEAESLLSRFGHCILDEPLTPCRAAGRYYCMRLDGLVHSTAF